MADKLLEVLELAVQFETDSGIVHAVNGVSFEVNRGESVAMVGESGCGKSTVALSLLNLLPPGTSQVSGSVRFRGVELVGLPESALVDIRGQNIGVVFQDPLSSLNPVLTVGYQLAESLRHHLGLSRSEARARSIELLELVRIPDPEQRLGAYPHQFSGGMRQRLMIAIALSCEPALLIADEPTTALDVTIQAQIIELVSELRERLDMSLIWISHDLGVVAGIADRVLVMYAGQIVEETTPDRLYSHPLHPYTAALLAAVPRVDRDSQGDASIEGEPPDPHRPPRGCPFAPRCPHVQELCRRADPPLHEVEPGHRSACWVDVDVGQLRQEMLDAAGVTAPGPRPDRR